MKKDQAQKIHNTTIAGRGSIITAVEVRSDLWTPFNPPGMLLPERFNFFIRPTVGVFQPREGGGRIHGPVKLLASEVGYGAEMKVLGERQSVASDRERPKAVLGLHGDHPPTMGIRGCYPQNIFLVLLRYR